MVEAVGLAEFLALSVAHYIGKHLSKLLTSLQYDFEVVQLFEISLVLFFKYINIFLNYETDLLR